MPNTFGQIFNLALNNSYSIDRLNSDGNEGHRHTFRITRSGNIASAGSVRFTTSSGTASSGVDFLPFTRDIQFLAGEDKKDVYVDSRKDSLNEGVERFNVSIAKINANDTISNANTFGQIFNLALNNSYSIDRLNSDGNEGHRHTFRITRSGDISSAGSVRFSSSSGTATSGVDFLPFTRDIQFQAGEREKDVYVDSLTDSHKEGTERFNVSISTVRTQDKLKTSSTFGQIFNVAVPATYSIEKLDSTVRKSDGPEGSRHYFRIKRTGNTASTGFVRFFSSNGTATSDLDFLPFSQTIVFKANEKEKDVYIDSIVDSLREGPEEFKVSIENLSAQDVVSKATISGRIGNRDISYVGSDKDGKPFKMKNVSSDPNWSVKFRVKDDRIDPRLPTYVYTHGWQDKAESSNSNLIFNSLIGAKANVINVDWSGMASVKKQIFGKLGFRPMEAVTVTNQVGETLADLLYKSKVDVSSITFIGHSLGSFVSASAASSIQKLSGKKARELVALDPAFPAGEYDIDARINGKQLPLDFTDALAVSTTSYTVSDLLGSADTSAGDNEKAVIAQKAFLVQFSSSDNRPTDGGEAAVGFHNAVIGVYADLFRKNALFPTKHPLKLNTFDGDGKLNAKGKFDGVIVAPTPWISAKESATAGNRKAARAVGWMESYKNPVIHGTASSDIMFFDKFKDDHSGSRLNGHEGDDVLIADQIDQSGIDHLTGGAGSDLFSFGYQRFSNNKFPYLDNLNNTGYGGNAYAVITDFSKSEDLISFGWESTQITYKPGSQIPAPTLGSGVGFFRDWDLITFVNGLSASDVPDLIKNSRITFGQFTQLDQALLV